MVLNMGTGWKLRLDILRRDAQQKFLDPLHMHGWKAAIEREVESGEYLLILAERGGQRHVVAFMYTSATGNAVYKSLAGQVEHIFFNGAPYMLESFAYGITTPVSAADDFHAVLLKWNAASADGKFVPIAENADAIAVSRPQHRVLLSEDPIQAIWFRLRQLQSVNLAKKLIVERAQRESVSLTDDAVRSKAEGVAYALRNASDYFQAREVRNVSQRVFNLYYGSLAFAFAEMLASPVGPKTLAEIEDSTKQGHGLYTIDGLSNGLEHLVVGVISRGFFPVWMKFMGLATDQIPEKKANDYDKIKVLPSTSWLTVERLFACIPEVSDLFSDIFESAPGWVMPIYDQSANAGPSIFAKKEPATRTYVQLADESARLTKEDIAAFPGPISEIIEVASDNSGRHFRVAIDHPDKNTWWDALQVHHSPFKRDALIMPIFGVVDEYRAICVVLLYALSIVVRYRPGIWRRVQEGDLDHMRVLIETFLAVVERVLPQQFLETITGQRIFVKQPGSFF
jgi:hypothetical protein